MKLWLLFITAGNIGGIAGPLPYDMTECRTRAAEMSQSFTAKTAEAVRSGQLTVAPDFSFACISRERKPTMGGKIND